MTSRLSLYGLTVEADFPLHQDRPCRSSDPVDVTIRRGRPVKGADYMPDGCVLLHFETDRPLYSAVRAPSGEYVLRFHGTCDFRISDDLREVAVHPMPDADPDMATILTVGGLLAFQLYLRGHAVLHASAVDIGDAAVAFVGSPGMGKSTMAALLCGDGAMLITDDVLRVDVTDGVARTRLGATELRIRKGADSLTERFAGTSAPKVRRSADDRQVLALADAASDRLPLRTIVIPAPSRLADRVETIRLPHRDAVYALINFPRLLGWRDQTVVGRHFEHVSRLVGTVPVFVARIPWGPPFRAGLSEELLRGVLT